MLAKAVPAGIYLRSPTPRRCSRRGKSRPRWPLVTQIRQCSVRVLGFGRGPGAPQTKVARGRRLTPCGLPRLPCPPPRPCGDVIRTGRSGCVNVRLSDDFLAGNEGILLSQMPARANRRASCPDALRALMRPRPADLKGNPGGRSVLSPSISAPSRPDKS